MEQDDRINRGVPQLKLIKWPLRTFLSTNHFVFTFLYPTPFFNGCSIINTTLFLKLCDILFITYCHVILLQSYITIVRHKINT